MSPLITAQQLKCELHKHTIYNPVCKDPSLEKNMKNTDVREIPQNREF